MVFNNIGNQDPLEFMAALDRLYVRDKVYGIESTVPDFLATVSHLHKVSSESFQFTKEDVENLRADIVKAMVAYDGEDRPACQALLVDILPNYGFDDPGSMILTRENPSATWFMNEVWEPLRHQIQMDIDASVPSPFAAALDISDISDTIEPE